jgi:hypothetical protein
MELVPPTPELEAMLSRQQAEYEDLVRASALPLLGLADPAPHPRMLGDAEISNGVVESVGLAYGDIMRPGGPLVQVHTARWRSARPPELADFLERFLDSVDDTSPISSATEPTQLIVGGVPRPASLLRAGMRIWAARCWHHGSDVIVVARDWELAAIRLLPVTNVEPFLRGRRTYVADLRANPPTMPIMDRPFDVATAHRSLVDATLDQTRQLKESVRMGRYPRLRGNARQTSELWEAAVRAQMHLADQSRQDANEAVTMLVNQLTQLYEKAAWFADDRLRAAAITESLMYWTEMRKEMPSRPAQEIWRRVWQARKDRLADPLAHQQRPVGRREDALRHRSAEPMQGQHEWLNAWSEWVSRKGN